MDCRAECQPLGAGGREDVRRDGAAAGRDGCAERQATALLTPPVRTAERAAAQGLPWVADMLRRCETERPEIIDLLSRAIETGIRPRGTPQVFVGCDPWYDESAGDVKDVPGLRLRGEVPALSTTVIFVAVGIAFLGTFAASS